MADPILISGAHRSGTTFMATALAAAPGVMHQRREPFNHTGYALDGWLPHGYAYAEDVGSEQVRERYAWVLTGRSAIGTRRQRLRCWAPFPPRLVLKDPLASFSLDWISRNLDVDVVVMVRHPAAFASSLKRMDWDIDFTALLRQERLMEEHLWEFADALRKPPEDIVSRAGLIWSCVNSFLARQLQAHPEWIMRRHEDVATHPIEEISAVYAALGLPWSDRSEEQVRALTQGDEVEAPTGQVHALVRDSRKLPSVWKQRLTSAEIDSVRRWTESTADVFYDDDSW